MSNPVTLSERQLFAVQSNEPMVVVAAAAGSGKTRVLTEKIIFEVVERGIPLERIAAITYTNKAADEMRIRLMQGFRQRNRPEDARQVHRAQIMTIHSFALGLLKKYAVDAGLDPSFGIVEDIDYQMMIDRAIDEALSDISRDDVARSLMLSEYAEYFQIKKSIKDAYEEWGTSRMHPQVAPVSENEFNCRMVEFVTLLEQAINEHDDGLIHLDHIRDLSEERVDQKLSALHRLSIDIQSSRKRYLSPIKEDCKTLIAFAADIQSIPVKRLLVDILIEIDKKMEDFKQRLNRISINDQINKLLNVMESSEVADEINQLFDWVMVDEFQDVNPAQYQLICHIASQCKKFFVGDVRQSIYGFRHADCSIFAGLTQSEEKTHTVIHLDENYRSHQGLIAEVNTIYDEIPCFESLNFGRVQALQKSPENECFFTMQLCTESMSSQEYRLAEAEHLAKLISARKKTTDKAYTYAILLKSMKHAFLYAEALKLQGVSSRILGSGGFYESFEVMGVMALLRWAQNPEDIIALSSVMKSDWMRISESTISELALHPKGFVEAVLTVPLEGVHSSDRRSLGLFRQWHSKVKERLSQGKLVSFCEWCVHYFDIPAVLSAHPSGEIRLGNLNKLLSIIRRCSEGSASDLKSLMDRLQILSESEEIREAEFDPQAADEAVVQIMSIHKSKGLEFDAVYIPNKEAKSRSDDGNVFYLNRSGEVVTSVLLADAQERIKTIGYQAHMAHIKKLQAEEKNRLYYVAMTRARRELIIAGNQTHPKNTRKEKDVDPIAMLTLAEKMPKFVHEWSVHERAGVEDVSHESDGRSNVEMIQSVLDSDGWINPDADMTWILAAPRDYPSEAVMTTTQVAELWEDTAPTFSRVGGGLVNASDYGNIFHEALQHYHFTAPPEREVDRLVSEFGKKLDIESENRFRQELTLFSESSLAEELANAENEGLKILREFSFVVRLSSNTDTADESVLIKGQADLIWKTASGKWKLVDYKSGQMHPAYSKQLEIYTYCLEKVSAMSFDSAQLYFSKTGELTEVDMTVIRDTDYADLILEKIRSSSKPMIQSMAKTRG